MVLAEDLGNLVYKFAIRKKIGCFVKQEFHKTYFESITPDFLM